jgi:ADP-ribosylglycohydrolase
MEGEKEMDRSNLIASRIRGGLLGVVVGDALGLPVQFRDRIYVRSLGIGGMTGYGTFNLPPGSWSDDSSLTLCLAESLCEVGYDLDDIGRRFVMWYRNGYWTPYGFSYDIGNATKEAMNNLIREVPPARSGPAGEYDNGNGSLMRILPAALYFAAGDVPEMLDRVAEVSRITHGHLRSQLACCIYSLLARYLLEGFDQHDVYAKLCSEAPQVFGSSRWAGELRHFKRILDGKLAAVPEGQIRSGGYVVDTLEAATWCLLHSDTFDEAVLMAVNLGDDTDTTGAVTGGLAGILCHASGIPREWIAGLARSEEIVSLASRFAEVVLEKLGM